MSDLISRADAIEAVRKCVVESELLADWNKAMESAQELLSALPSADAVPQLKQTDTLIIADALRYLAQDTERHLADRTRADALRQQFLKYGASMCHLADAVQGEWVHDGQNFKGGLDWCHCSVCGQKTSTNGLSMYNFCPNCGARMKGGDDK